MRMPLNDTWKAKNAFWQRAKWPKTLACYSYLVRQGWPKHSCDYLVKTGCEKGNRKMFFRGDLEQGGDRSFSSGWHFKRDCLTGLLPVIPHSCLLMSNVQRSRGLGCKTNDKKGHWSRKKKRITKVTSIRFNSFVRVPHKLFTTSYCKIFSYEVMNTITGCLVTWITAHSSDLFSDRIVLVLRPSSENKVDHSFAGGKNVNFILLHSLIT